MPKKLIWKNLVGQDRIKDTLAAAFENDSLGHAYLFCGAAGVGKFQAALELALAIHCTNNGDIPCYTCKSCRQILSFSHPDFHCVFPVTLESVHKSSGDSNKLSEEGWSFITQEMRKKLAAPYSLNESRLRHIPVEWIRELNHAIMRGTIQGKTNVAIICDVDIMQAASANAMLKTLEEPPQNTVILLLSQRPHSVLPTIRSRCQIFRFGSVASDILSNSLGKACSLDPDDPKIKQAVACAAGSYGKALSLIEESLDIFAGQANHLWELCVKETTWNAVIDALEMVTKEYLGGGWDYAAGEKLMISFLHLIRTNFFQSIDGTEKYINGVNATGAAIPIVSVETADKLYTSCEKAISAIRARGNVLLVLFTFLMSVSEIVHGKKQ